MTSHFCVLFPGYCLMFTADMRKMAKAVL